MSNTVNQPQRDSVRFLDESVTIAANCRAVGIRSLIASNGPKRVGLAASPAYNGQNVFDWELCEDVDSDPRTDPSDWLLAGDASRFGRGPSSIEPGADNQ